MSNPKNKVQAPHHQIVAIEEAERAIEAGRAIGTNDIISHALRHLDPRVAAPMAHALSYQLRIGAKDDEQMEIEKAIWWLMDAHNRLSDIREQERQYAPWDYTGKIKEVKGTTVELEHEETYEKPEEGYKWVEVFEPFVKGLIEFDQESRALDMDKFEEGDTIKFTNLSKLSSLKENLSYTLKKELASYAYGGVLLRVSEGQSTHGWAESTRVFKKVKV